MPDFAPALMLFVAAQGYAASDHPVIDRFAAMLEGRYEIDNEEIRMTDRRIRIEAPDIGEVVFYMQVNQGPELDVYRQRILVFETDGPVIYQRAYSFVEPGTWVDATANQLAGLGTDDVKPTLPGGCETRWLAVEKGFRGYTDPHKCLIISSRTGKPRRIESETVLTQSTISLIERGFDEQGVQLFGTKPGDSLELRRAD